MHISMLDQWLNKTRRVPDRHHQPPAADLWSRVSPKFFSASVNFIGLASFQLFRETGRDWLSNFSDMQCWGDGINSLPTYLLLFL